MLADLMPDFWNLKTGAEKRVAISAQDFSL